MQSPSATASERCSVAAEFKQPVKEKLFKTRLSCAVHDEHCQYDCLHASASMLLLLLRLLLLFLPRPNICAFTHRPRGVMLNLCLGRQPSLVVNQRKEEKARKTERQKCRTYKKRERKQFWWCRGGDRLRPPGSLSCSSSFRGACGPPSPATCPGPLPSCLHQHTIVHPPTPHSPRPAPPHPVPTRQCYPASQAPLSSGAALVLGRAGAG